MRLSTTAPGSRSSVSDSDNSATRLKPRQTDKVRRGHRDTDKTPTVNRDGSLTDDDDVTDRETGSRLAIRTVIAVVSHEDEFGNLCRIADADLAAVTVSETITVLVRPAETGVEIVQNSIVNRDA